jgi:hypothetical protein
VGASPPDSCSGKAKNEAKNGGGRKREPKEEADFSPGNPRRRLKKNQTVITITDIGYGKLNAQHDFCQIKCVEGHFRWGV